MHDTRVYYRHWFCVHWVAVSVHRPWRKERGEESKKGRGLSPENVFKSLSWAPGKQQHPYKCMMPHKLPALLWKKNNTLTNMHVTHQSRYNLYAPIKVKPCSPPPPPTKMVDGRGVGNGALLTYCQWVIPSSYIPLQPGTAPGWFLQCIHMQCHQIWWTCDLIQRLSVH